MELSLKLIACKCAFFFSNLPLNVDRLVTLLGMWVLNYTGINDIEK